MTKQEPTTQQYFALKACIDFVYNSDEKAMVVSGVAGSGKTFLIYALAEMLCKDFSVGFASLTNRVVANAMYNIKQIFGYNKANGYGGTLHSLFYTPIYPDMESDGEHQYQTRPPIRFEPKDREKLLSDLSIFCRKNTRHVLLVDEASMIPEKMLDQIIDTFPGCVIFFGDSFQLPPVEGKFNLMETWDVALNEIHRAAGDSDIIRLSKEIRETGTYKKTRYKNSKDVRFVSRRDVTKQFLQENRFDMILCGTHRTRKKMNHLSRVAAGTMDRPYPYPGEPVTPDRTYTQFVSRGSIIKVRDCAELNRINGLTRLELDITENVEFQVPYNYWTSESMDDVEPKIRRRDDISLFSYAYAMTVHKAQGSEFNSLLFMNEDVSYFLEQPRFVYTAITRAKKMLTIAE